jgi:hypothetical protein
MPENAGFWPILRQIISIFHRYFNSLEDLNATLFDVRMAEIDVESVCWIVFECCGELKNAAQRWIAATHDPAAILRLPATRAAHAGGADLGCEQPGPTENGPAPRKAPDIKTGSNTGEPWIMPSC